MIAWLLIQSLSLSPFSMTQHFYKSSPTGYASGTYPGKEIARPLGAPFNVHPQIILNYSEDYFQIGGGVILYDTQGQFTFPLLAGPKFKNIGLVVGGMLRQTQFPPSSKSVKFGPRVFEATGESRKAWELSPAYGVTYQFSFVQFFLNHEILNVGMSFELPIGLGNNEQTEKHQ